MEFFENPIRKLCFGLAAAVLIFGAIVNFTQHTAASIQSLQLSAAQHQAAIDCATDPTCMDPVLLNGQ